MNMNQWGNDQFIMIPHMMGSNIGPGSIIRPGHNLVPPQPLLPTPMRPPPGPEGMGPPMIPSGFMFHDWNTGENPIGSNSADSFIGPQKPHIDLTKDNKNQVTEVTEHHGRDGRRDRDRDRRPHSPHNNRDKRDRSRNDRRDRRPQQRWSDNTDKNNIQGLNEHITVGNIVTMPGTNVMPFGNNMMMSQQQIDMGNMQNMMSNMPNMIPGMNMMQNMMPGMMPHMRMDQNMTMNNQQMICMSSGVLLPPLPNAAMPSRRERPSGCRTIFVGGLPHGFGEEVIRDIFERFGVVTDVKLHNQGVCHVRFGSQEMVEQAFFICGYRFKRHDQLDTEATLIFIDYALNREDQSEYERTKRKRTPSPPRVELYTQDAFAAVTEKIKSDNEFSDAAPTLAGWLERGECNKKNANAFYSLIQASNNQVRRLYTEKMALDEEFQNVKGSLRNKFAGVITQFEQVGKILMAAKVQRVSDHFSKQQRRNIELWLKMTEDVENIKEEFNTMFEEDEGDDKHGKGNNALLKKYTELKVEHENLQRDLEGHRNEAHLAKDEAERKFEKYKAHFIAQQALLGNQMVYPPLPPPPPAPALPACRPPLAKPAPPPSPTKSVSPSEAKLISVLTAFLLVHPLGASLDYLVSYVRSIIPTVTQGTVHSILQRYSDVFSRQMSGVGANIESKWTFITYDVIKKQLTEV